jgi:hypothetical protein
MKKVLSDTFLVFACLLSLAATAQEKEKHAEPKFKKNKTYSKSYALGSSDKVDLSNQFGEMKFVTWDKAEIKVDISITGKSDEEKRAQEILDKISILDSKEGNTVSFRTKFADEDNKNKNANKNENNNRNENYNEGMEINYTIYLPSSNSLKASNQFGKMIVPDYKGEVTLESKFGSLEAGKLSKSKEVTVEFGKADIQLINGGDLNIKFSNGTVNKLSGDVRSDLEFSKVKLDIDNEIRNLTIHNSYSTVYLDLDKNFSANWDIQTSHGNFSNKTAFAIKDQDENENKGYGPRFNKNYKGVSGSGSAKVKINSSFGEIIAGHDLQVDMTDRKRGTSGDRQRDRSGQRSSMRVI